jgi:hypothetical protein
LGLGASPLCRLTRALSRPTILCRGIAVPGLVLPAGAVRGDGSGFFELLGRLVQKR